MRSHRTAEFRKAYGGLRPFVPVHARRAFRIWVRDPCHPGLQFKQVHQSRPIYAVRIGIHWRAPGVRRGDLVTWFWIGSHEGYDKLIASL